MKKYLALFFAVVLAFCFVACDAAPAAEAPAASGEAAPKKIGVVYTVNGRGDLAFNDSVYEGAERAAKELGVVVTHTEPKSVSEIEMSLEELSASGEYDLIISLCFESMDAAARVAAEYPEQMYVHIDDDLGLDNVRSYLGQENESAFLGGVLAGLMQSKEYCDSDLITDSKTIGIIGAVDANVVNRHIAGYMAGAKYVDPDIEVIYDYVGGFDDVAGGQSMAESMYAKGINICYNAASACGLGMYKAAGDKGFVAIGLDSNQNYIDPDHIAFSTMKNVDVWTYDAIKDIVDGTFTGGAAPMGLKDNGLGIAYENSNIVISDAAKEIVEGIKQKIIDGELTVPVTIADVDPFLAANHFEG